MFPGIYRVPGNMTLLLKNEGMVQFPDISSLHIRKLLPNCASSAAFFHPKFHIYKYIHAYDTPAIFTSFAVSIATAETQNSILTYKDVIVQV